MRYHDIVHDDMRNGDGLRVTLFVSGCSHHCKGCQNPVTWDPDDGEVFWFQEIEEIAAELEKDYISGITLSGGDPLFRQNRREICSILSAIKRVYPKKTVWIYTGYTWEDLENLMMNDADLAEIICMYTDVLVDGPYIENLRDTTLHWVGSSNQRVIDVRKTLETGAVVLWSDDYKDDGARYIGKCGCGE